MTLVVFATLRIVTALFLKETLSTAANDAEMVIEDSRRFALQYQKKLEDPWVFIGHEYQFHKRCFFLQLYIYTYKFLQI